MDNISLDFQWNKTDARILSKLVEYEATPKAIQFFAKVCAQLTDYGYWFGLSVLWVSYTGYSDLELWKSLFSSDRPRRSTSIMKPNELIAFNHLPETVPAFRVHRPGETDWISYTLSRKSASDIALRRGVREVGKYAIEKKDILALFLRRGEFEIIVLDKAKAVRTGTVPVIVIVGQK